MKVLLIEDDREIVEFISLAFQVGWPGIKLVATRLGEEGVELVEKESPDIVILDLGLPDIDGFEVLKQIRFFSMVPIMVLTVRVDEIDIVRGLEEGADEYMAKPFGQMELLARIKAVLRRRYQVAGETPIICGPFRFGQDMRDVFYREKKIRVTATESIILRRLANNAGQVVSHSTLSEMVWGDDSRDGVDALKVYIRRLRIKFEADPSHPQLILTKPGIGYLLGKNN